MHSCAGPFLWSGFWYGLLGSLLSLALVWYGLFLLQPTVERLAGLYQGSGIAVLAPRCPGQPDDHGRSASGYGLVGSWFAGSETYAGD